MRYVAPAASMENILKSVPSDRSMREWALRIPPTAPEAIWVGMTMRKLFTIIRMQRVYRQNRRRNRVKKRIQELELKLATFQVTR